jgi:hypothetical protein
MYAMQTSFAEKTRGIDALLGISRGDPIGYSQESS